MSDAVVRWDSIEHAYQDDFVFRHLTSRLNRGECRLLAGSNGSGKTTLLRIVAGLLRATGGSVTWFDDSDAPDEAVRARIGYLGHGVGLYADLTGRENLRFFSRLYDADESRIEGLLDRLELAHRADEPIRSYSRGMKQRLAIARALVHGPDLLLLDEPFTGLDASGADILETLLREATEAGGSVLFTSHRLDRATRVATGATVFARAATRDIDLDSIPAGERAALVLSAMESGERTPA
ncbi:MAG: heme ABC exporter ATP-binding protein CcmA [Gemmatimonadetes bacterium]|nr:heme ABC exporter ATP-binding protein CcmA [Gemmatimonadota bacterium]